MPIALPLFVSLGLLITMSSLSIGLVVALPPGTQLPIHFTLSGEPTSFASAGIALSLLPAAAALATLLFAIGPKIDGRIAAIQGRYLAIWLGTVFVLALAHGVIIRGALFALKASLG
ncbi:hypothetical protein ACQKKX_01330 [Neorhizobium sp. NPDC001467]|uniref:hypothetical protein n=1 Tax=Neorhizobium sp. NPDC001467 TaxID=3390595 RepID=UPI003CFD9951